MASSFDEAVRRALRHEGGYADHPSDPGGPTKYGITLGVVRSQLDPKADAAAVKRLTLAQATAIYRAAYWDVLRCDELPRGVDYAVFDYGVNSGVARAAKVLRRVLGLGDNPARVTAEVIAAAARADAAALVVALCEERLRFLRGLSTWPVFGGGWGRRVAEVQRDALAMATGAADGCEELKVARAAKAAAAAATAAAAGGVAAQQAHAQGMPAVIVVGAIAITVVLIAVIFWLAARRRAVPAQAGELAPRPDIEP